jgi:hypothetical protein
MNLPQGDLVRSEPVGARRRSKKWLIVGAVGVSAGFCVVLVLGYQDLVNGPTPEEALTRLLCDPIPSSVKNLKRPLYVPSLDGPRIVLTFEIEPAELSLVFPSGQFAPFYSAENGFAREYLAEMCEELAEPDFIELKSALIMTDRGGNDDRAVIVSHDKRRVFYHYHH